MATGTKHREHYERSGGDLAKQPNRFAGLALMPLVGLLASWIIHVYTAGVDLHLGSHEFKTAGSQVSAVLVAIVITLTAVGLAFAAWHFTAHRERPKRTALTGSVLAVGVFFAISTGVGPHRVWSAAFVFVGEVTAILWSMARLDVARNDKSSDEAKEDGFLEKHGLKGWRARKVTPVADEKGQPLATEIEFQHAEGDGVDQLQSAVGAFESATGSPAGLSNATPSERADRSTIKIMHRDPLIERRALPEPSAPGGSIADGLVIGVYAYGTPVVIYMGGENPRLENGPVAPANKLYMGMTRTGKTVAENEAMTEMGTRRDVVILYLNKSKGSQDWRSISPVTEVAVLANDGNEATAAYRRALQEVKKIMAYREKELGRFGISAWSAQACFHSPPWRDGPDGRERMQPIPLLYVHVGEADSILANEGQLALDIASKCLSLGIVFGCSLQRADYQSMPTGLRFNIGIAICTGCGDSYSSEFALSESTVKAGAHPENWKQNKPGYFYIEGPGIDESLFPVPARSFGDESKEVLARKLLDRNLTWGPRMATLDAGSVAATDYDGGNWWREAAAATEVRRAELLGQAVPQTATANPTANAPQNDDDEYTAELRKLRSSGDEVADDEQEELRVIREEMEEELRGMTHVDGFELYPVDPVTGERGSRDDVEAKVEKVPADRKVTWGGSKPEARTREEALAALAGACREILGDADEVVTTPAEVYRAYGFRERPWFVTQFGKAANGELELPGTPVIEIERAPDLGLRKGAYRIRKIHAA